MRKIVSEAIGPVMGTKRTSPLERIAGRAASDFSAFVYDDAANNGVEINDDLAIRVQEVERRIRASLIKLYSVELEKLY